MVQPGPTHQCACVIPIAHPRRSIRLYAANSCRWTAQFHRRGGCGDFQVAGWLAGRYEQNSSSLANAHRSRCARSHGSDGEPSTRGLWRCRHSRRKQKSQAGSEFHRNSERRFRFCEQSPRRIERSAFQSRHPACLLPYDRDNHSHDLQIVAFTAFRPK